MEFGTFLLLQSPSAESSEVAKAKELFGWAQKLYKQARYTEAIGKVLGGFHLEGRRVVIPPTG